MKTLIYSKNEQNNVRLSQPQQLASAQPSPTPLFLMKFDVLRAGRVFGLGLNKNIDVSNKLLALKLGRQHLKTKKKRCAF